jgi:hypothetical protein
VNVPVDEAVEHCHKLDSCKGFSVNHAACFGGQVALVRFKRSVAGNKNTTDRAWNTWAKAGHSPGYLISTLTLSAGDAEERLCGLGQGNWTQEGGCPAGPLERGCRCPA